MKYNKSKTYLLPLISEIVDIKPNFFKYLKDTYISDDMGKYEDCIYILHDFSFKNPEFTAYENNLVANEYFVDLYDIGDKVLYIFKVPDEYMHEYNKFKQGKYSEYGTDAKELILAFFTGVYQNNLNAINFLMKLKQILFKEPALRKKMELELKVKINHDAELTDPPNIERETFQLSEYKDRDLSKLE